MPVSDQHPTVEYPSLKLYVGRPTAQPQDDRGRLHRHSNYELTWLAKGRASIMIDFQTYDITAGTLTFVLPGQLHQLAVEWPEADLFVLGFQAELFELGGSSQHFLNDLAFLEIGAVPLLTVAEAEQPLLNSLFGTIRQRFEELGPNEIGLLLSYLTTILLEIKRVHHTTLPLEPMTPARALTKSFRQAIEIHYQERLSVNEYADMLGVTSNHLVRTVRQTTGTPPGQMLHERLLLEAKRLLVYSSDPVADIASKLAFNTPSQFGHWFKRLAGESPQNFRHSLLNE